MPPPARQVDIVGVGLNAFDTIIRLPSFPSFDSKMEIISSQQSPGGQVASAMVACRRWGLHARYIGKIGSDFAGRLHRDVFQHEDVEARLIEVPDCESQLAFILIDQSSGERTILWKRDPRLDIDPGEIRPEWIGGARLLHVDGHPSAPAAAAARIAHIAGMIVTADLDNIYPGVEALLEEVDFVFSSREFPERLTGIPDVFESLPAIASRYNCRVVGATLGSDGVLAWDGHAFHYSPAFDVKTIDTTGAGDIFHAGFAYSLLEGQPLEHCLEFSCAAAALNCTAPGARGGIRPVSEILQLIEAGKRRSDAFTPAILSERTAQARSSPVRRAK